MAATSSNSCSQATIAGKSLNSELCVKLTGVRSVAQTYSPRQPAQRGYSRETHKRELRCSEGCVIPGPINTKGPDRANTLTPNPWTVRRASTWAEPIGTLQSLHQQALAIGNSKNTKGPEQDHQTTKKSKHPFPFPLTNSEGGREGGKENTILPSP